MKEEAAAEGSLKVSRNTRGSVSFIQAPPHKWCRRRQSRARRGGRLMSCDRQTLSFDIRRFLVTWLKSKGVFLLAFGSNCSSRSGEASSTMRPRVD